MVLWIVPSFSSPQFFAVVRMDSEQKGTPVVQLLKERTQHSERNPVVVFPEGTTSNGKYLVSVTTVIGYAHC